jgi:hypothetical protein
MRNRAPLQRAAEESRRGRSRFNRARNLNRAHSFRCARHVHRKRNEENGRHHKGHRTNRRRFVILAAIHRAIAHADRLRGHVVPAILMSTLVSDCGIRVRGSDALVMMVLWNIAKAVRAARHRRRRKRSRCQRRIKRRNRQQTSECARQSNSIVAFALQGRPGNRYPMIVQSSRRPL